MPRYSVTPAIGGGTAPIVFGAWDVNAAAQQAGRDQVRVGRLNESGARRPVLFDITRETVVALFGKRGSGKSYTLGVLAEGLCTVQTRTSLGSLTRSRAILLLDTLNVFWSTANPFAGGRDATRFKSELAQLAQWDIEAPELDAEVWLLAGSEPEALPNLYRSLTIATSALTSDDAHDLLALDPSTPSGQLLTDAWTMVRAARPDFAFGDVLTTIEESEELADYYAESTRRAVRQRLRSYSANPAFARTGTPMVDLLRPGRLTILELGDLDDHQRTTISAVLLRQIHRQRQEAATLEKQLTLNTRLTDAQRTTAARRLAELIPPSWILVDEAQSIFPADRTTRATDAFVRFVKEGRNFGLSFALTTQQPSAVDQRILSQVDTVICHQLTVEADITRMRDNMKSALPQEVKAVGRRLDIASWLRSLEPGEALVTNTDFDRAFAIAIRPRVCPHAGSGFVYSAPGTMEP